MKLYAVRVIEDKQPVGFFWVENLTELWWAVDSVCNPNECEYKSVNCNAAIVWEGPESWKMGERERDSGDDEEDEKRWETVLKGISFDGAIWGAMSQFVGGLDTIRGWKPLEAKFDDALEELTR